MIYDHLGRPVETKQLTREIAQPTLTGVRALWNSTVAGGLTPSRMAALLRSAATGDARDYLTLAEEMEERDLHYRCEIGKRRLAVSSLPVTVEAASDEDEDQKLAEEIRTLAKAPSFRGLCKDLLDGLGKGYSVCEIEWRRGAKWLPAAYPWRDQRFFTFDQESRTKIRLLDEQDSFNGIELPAYKFVVHLPHLKTGIPLRGGLAMVVAWSYLCKNYTVKDWLAFAEVFGMPLRVGKYGAGASPADIEILRMAVANLGSDAAAVIPESMLIEFVESAKTTGGQDLFMKLADWLDAQVSKGILGQTATTQGTPGKLGNEEAQSEVRHDIRDDDAMQLSATINRDLVRPFVDLNWGPRERYPELVLRAQEQEDLTVLTAALEKLVPLGLRVEQSVIRDKYGLPDPAEDIEPELLLGADKNRLFEYHMKYGAVKINEVRSMLGLPPVPGGDKLLERTDVGAPLTLPSPGGRGEEGEMNRALNAAGTNGDYPPELIAEQAGEQGQQAVTAWVEGIRAMLESASSLPEFREMLITSYGDLPTDQLGQVMAQGMSAARAAGMFDIEEGADG